MGNTLETQKIYIKGLAFLRTISIFGIILYHMFPFDIKGGFLGVSLFFLLSGYLIAIQSENLRRVHMVSVPGFYKNRILRIYPSTLIMMFVTIGAYRFLSPRSLVGSRLEVVSILLGFNNYWQIAENATYFARISNTSPFTHMWSLSNELQFYLIWPVIFFIFIFFTISKSKKFAANTILVLALLFSLIMPLLYDPVRDVTRIYYGMDTRLFSFLTGTWLGFRRIHFEKEDYAKISKGLANILFIICLFIVAIAYVLVDGEASYTYLGGMFIANAIFALILFLVAGDGYGIGARLENKVFLFFGNISFEMYLWMYPVIAVFSIRHWSRSLYAPILELIIILMLSVWLNKFVKILLKRDFSLKGDFWEKMKKAVVLQAAAIAAVAVLIGTYSMFTSASSKSLEDENLQADLEENKKLLEEQESLETLANEAQTDIIEESREEIKLLDSVSMIGDSVMLGAVPAIKDIMPQSYVDAAESRQATAALDIIDDMRATGNLGKTMVIGLGTNGVINEVVGQEIIDYLGDDTYIFWVNVYGDTLSWMEDANEVIDKLVAENDNVFLVDWAIAGAANPDWFYNDGIHLKPEGQDGYAKNLMETIQKTQLQLNKTSTGQ